MLIAVRRILLARQLIVKTRRLMNLFQNSIRLQLKLHRQRLWCRWNKRQIGNWSSVGYLKWVQLTHIFVSRSIEWKPLYPRAVTCSCLQVFLLKSLILVHTCMWTGTRNPNNKRKDKGTLVRACITLGILLCSSLLCWLNFLCLCLCSFYRCELSLCFQ